MKIPRALLHIGLCISTIVSVTHGFKNVLFILGDDAGPELSCYGNHWCPTPNLDRLAQKSIVYKNAYTTVSSCSPSRSTILSGLHNHQNGIFGLISGQFQSYSYIRSLPQILKNYGIKTGIIGKKHVKPDDIYQFDYERTEEEYNEDKIGRNITFMNEFVSEFLDIYSREPFMLYMGFHDTHLYTKTSPPYGVFAEHFGDGTVTPGDEIPDWTPVRVHPDDVEIPPFLPDTPLSREDGSKMCTGFNRMDQGIGLVISNFEKRGLLNDTLVMFTSDNGVPFIMAKTNLYQPGAVMPFLLSRPEMRADPDFSTTFNYNLTTHLNVLPTVFDYFGIDIDQVEGQLPYNYTGQSILAGRHLNESVMLSHTNHEIPMYNPMRVLLQPQPQLHSSSSFKLIHNLNSKMPYQWARDIIITNTSREILFNYHTGRPIGWKLNKTMEEYYYRPQYELFNLEKDPMEENNLSYDTRFKERLDSMKAELQQKQVYTDDQLQCLLSGVFLHSACHSSQNGFSSKNL